MIQLLNSQIRLFDVITLISLHFIGNFLFQNSWQTTNKSFNIRALSSHVSNYCLTLLILMSIIYMHYGYDKIVLFILITFIIHWIQDFITSRIGYRLKLTAQRTRNWRYYYLHRGLDQLLHYLQLFLTFYFIFK